MGGPLLPLLGLLLASVAGRVGVLSLAPTTDSGRLDARLEQAVRFFYFAGLPYLTVILGLITPNMLGLKGLEHFGLVNFNASTWLLQLQQASTLLLLEIVLDSQGFFLSGGAAFLFLLAIWLTLRRQGLSLAFAPHSGLEILYQTLHWSFYRAIFWALTGSLYLGVVLGVGLVLLEWALCRWRQPGWRTQPLLPEAMILFATATLFFYTPNLWLLWPFHWLIDALLRFIFPHSASLRSSYAYPGRLPE